MHHALDAIADPLIEAALLGALGIVCVACRRWRLGGAVIVIAGLWAWLCFTPAFALVLWRGLANQYAPRPLADYPRADAIVLVGGGPLPRPFASWSADADPALATPLGVAVALYRSGKAPLLVALGNYGMPSQLRVLGRQGVPATATRAAEDSQTTHGDARRAAAMLHAQPDARILLIATGMHMPRALATFRREGFHATPAPPAQPAWVARWTRTWRPDRAALALSRSCLHEYLGIVYYRLRGWASW